MVQQESERKPYKVEITEVTDENGDGRIDLADVEYLMRNKKNTMTLLDGNGDFRSPECVELLKQADIVATNEGVIYGLNTGKARNIKEFAA